MNLIKNLIILALLALAIVLWLKVPDSEEEELGNKIELKSNE